MDCGGLLAGIVNFCSPVKLKLDVTKVKGIFPDVAPASIRLL